MRMTQQQLDQIAARPGYSIRGRGPDKQKRKEGSGQRKTYPDYNRMLIAELETKGARAGVPEHRFHETRKWRIDLAYPDLKLAIEIDGAVHRIRERFKSDLAKHQALLLAGWRLLRVSTAQVRSGEAARLVERALSLPA